MGEIEQNDWYKKGAASRDKEVERLRMQRDDARAEVAILRNDLAALEAELAWRDTDA